MQKENESHPVTRLFEDPADGERASAPVAVLDSGVGGICVLRQLHKILPCEDLLYFGDSANAPYGEREEGEIREIVCAHAQHLLGRAKALVLACNTATAACIDVLRASYPSVPIVGMEPALRPALATGVQGNVLLMATPATLRLGKWRGLCESAEKSAHVHTLCAPKLVEFAERGELDSPALHDYLQEILQPFVGMPLHALVLGCTHFPLFEKAILDVLGVSIPVFDGIAGTARQTANRLRDAALLNPLPGRGSITLTSSAHGVLPLYAKLLFQ